MSSDTALIIWLVSAGFFLTTSAIVVIRRFRDREDAAESVKKIMLVLLASFGLFAGGLELASFLTHRYVTDLVFGIVGFAFFAGASLTWLRKLSAKKGA